MGYLPQSNKRHPLPKALTSPKLLVLYMEVLTNRITKQSVVESPIWLWENIYAELINLFGKCVRSNESLRRQLHFIIKKWVTI